MKLFRTILTLTCLIGTSALAEEHAYIITTELYRVTGDSDLTAEDDSKGSTLGFLEESDTDHALDFSGSRLTLKDGDLHWTGTALKENDSISLLARPTIQTFNGAEARIEMTQEIPMQMLKPVEGDIAEEEFELTIVQVEQGLKVSVIPSGSPDSDTIILNLKVEYSAPAGNAPLADTELEAGPVIMSKSVLDTTLRATNGVWFVNTIKAGEDDHILFFAKVEHVEK
ncbi:MAG: hypothetical protein VCD00_21215 [Candidatus Hydrogenedentota bacterium]